MEIKMIALPGTKPSVVGKINVKIDEDVKKDQELLQVETAKGNRTIKAPVSGVIKDVKVVEGQNVVAGEVLFVLEENKEEEEETVVAKKNVVALSSDICVIGGGPGGYVAAIYAAKKGKKVVLVEKGKLGGTCLNVGCIPTKALIKSSEVYASILDSESFGLEKAEIPAPDMKNLVERKDKIVKRLVDGIDFLMNKNNIKVISGAGSFKDRSTVAVESGDEIDEISFTDAIIATGSVSSKINIPGIENEFVLDSTKALSLLKLPEHLTIIGGGAIGLEFAFLFNSLGSKVTVIEFLDRLVSNMDKDISSEILKIAEKKGIKIELSSKVKEFSPLIDGKGIVLFEKDGKDYRSVCDKAIVAVGRASYFDKLNAEGIGIELNDRGRGIKVDKHMKTNLDHIYAIGDVNNLIQLAHAASEEGIIAVKNILNEEASFNVSDVPAVIFTTPEIASVGICEEKAKALGIEYKIGHFDFVGNGKALTMNEEDGFIKILKDKDDTVIGATLIGPDASSLISALSIAVKNHLKDSELVDTIFPHPTTGEVIHEAALDLSIGALHQ
ncbi:MAG: dihydrolipoyl dehydrogenase [Bacillales bacterium]|nr:dihydrolipoyl dehydrogenase [Bacillales bacterium]